MLSTLYHVVYSFILFLHRAFVAPADIQAFTNEAKNKLSARCQGKTKYFTQAVKEICTAYDELEKQKTSGLRDNINGSHVGSDAPSIDGVVDHLKDAADDVVLNVEQANTYGQDVGSKLEHCTQRCVESDSQDEKPSVSGRPVDSLSPVSSPLIKSNSSIGEEQNKHACKSGLKDPSCLKVEVSDCSDACKVNGNKPRKLGTGSSRSEAADDRKRSGGSNRTFLKDESSAADLSRSGEALKGGKKGKNAFSAKSDSPDARKLDSDINCGNKDKNLKTSLKVKKKSQEIFVDSEEGDGKSSLKQNKTQVHGKRKLGSNEILHATKKLKCMDTKNDKTMKSLLEDVNSASPRPASPRSPVVDDKELKKPELKRSTSRLKTEKGLPSRAQPSMVGSDDSVHEVLSGPKHHSQVQQAMSDSAGLASDENTEMSSLRQKNDANNLKIKQVQRKRRAVCLVDYDDDDGPKTPVHGGAAKNVKSPSFVSEVMKSNDACPENADVAQLANRKSCAVEDSNSKEPSSESHNDTLSTVQPQTEKADKVIPVDLPHSPAKLDLKQFPSKMEKLSSISPVKSPQSVTTRSNVERHKSSKPLLKVSGNATQKKTDHGSSKSLNSINSSQNQVATNKKKLASSVESSKTTPKTLPQAAEVPAATEDFKELGAFHVDRSIYFSFLLFLLSFLNLLTVFSFLPYLCYYRLDVGLEEKSSQYTGSKTPENAKTMKHLIAAAQAKRRLVAQSQCLPPGLNNVLGGTPSPSTVQPFLSISSNFVQADQQGVYEHPTSVSPSTNGHHSASQIQLEAEENEERRVGSVQRVVGGSLSGGTEAAVARDAFEGMIETLSRTKESIGRATRLAIDCAKYGIANEVCFIILLLLI